MKLDRNNLTTRQLANHLKLALQEDNVELRKRVELLYSAVKPREKRHKRMTEFIEKGKNEYVVILHREDAKMVEEIFFAFIDRSNIGGDWRIKTLRPERHSNIRFKFRFQRLPDPLEIIDSGTDKKVSKRKAKGVDDTFNSLGAEEQLKFLEAKMAKLGIHTNGVEK